MSPEDSPFLLRLPGDAWDVPIVALGMALIAGVLWVLYRTLDAPRLPVNQPPHRAPFATWPGVVRYAVTTPFMVTFWFGAVVILISLGTDTRDGAGVALASAAVVGGARIVAHVSRDLANEIAKTVPIAILTLIVVGGGATDATLDTIGASLDAGVLLRYWSALIVLDVVMTTLWFVAQRRRWHGRAASPAGRWSAVVARWRSIGYVGT